MINKAQKPMPWLTLGTDLLIGSTGDNKAEFRDQMFLPEDLMRNLSLTMIKDIDKIMPLLQKPETVLDFKPVTLDNKVFFRHFSYFQYFINNHTNTIHIY